MKELELLIKTDLDQRTEIIRLIQDLNQRDKYKINAWESDAYELLKSLLKNINEAL